MQTPCPILSLVNDGKGRSRRIDRSHTAPFREKDGAGRTRPSDTTLEAVPLVMPSRPSLASSPAVNPQVIMMPAADGATTRSIVQSRLSGPVAPRPASYSSPTALESNPTSPNAVWGGPLHRRGTQANEAVATSGVSHAHFASAVDALTTHLPHPDAGIRRRSARETSRMTTPLNFQQSTVGNPFGRRRNVQPNATKTHVSRLRLESADKWGGGGRWRSSPASLTTWRWACSIRAVHAG